MSVHGKVLPHTPLAVDFWQVRKCPGTRLFFLSHMHSDHTVGLTSTWNHRPIYCSPTTATLLRLKLQVKEHWIHPLEVGEPHLLPLDDIGKERLAVTLIDANHCPGAVMFLFEGYFGSILYTGDFRYSPSMLREPCMRTNATIDVLYLDNTNCDPNRSLPSRQRATQQIKEIIRSHPNHCVVIGLYSLGKESLLVELAMEFKTWIEVGFERMETLKVLELPDVFTTDPGAGRIRVVEQSEICSAIMHQWNKEQPTLAIFPTSRPLTSFHPNVHVVPYSDHSSYRELEDFVTALKPSSLVPIVGNCVPESLSALLPSKKRHAILVPESVRRYMLKQPESQLSSSALTRLHHRHFRPLAPRGVVFDSPVKPSRKSHDEAWEAECLEQDSSEEAMDADLWSLNIFQTVSEEMLMVEAVPLSQLTQSDFNPVEVLTNAKTGLKPVRVTRGPFETKGKTIKESASSENFHQQSRQVQNINILSDGDGSQLHSGDRIDQNNEIMLNVSITSQNGGHGANQNSSLILLQSSPDNRSCSSSSSLSKMQHEYVEETDNSILNILLFTEEDLRGPWGLIKKNSIQMFPLCPFKEDDLSDS